MVRPDDAGVSTLGRFILFPICVMHLIQKRAFPTPMHMGGEPGRSEEPVGRIPDTTARLRSCVGILPSEDRLVPLGLLRLVLFEVALDVIDARTLATCSAHTTTQAHTAGVARVDELQIGAAAVRRASVLSGAIPLAQRALRERVVQQGVLPAIVDRVRQAGLTAMAGRCVKGPLRALRPARGLRHSDCWVKARLSGPRALRPHVLRAASAKLPWRTVMVGEALKVDRRWAGQGSPVN